MKLISIIIATVIIGLIAAPSIKWCSAALYSMDTCCNDVCCDTKSDKNEATCNGNFCNPFSLCCAFVLHVNTTNQLSFANTNPEGQSQFNYLAPDNANVTVEFWQPPKLF